MRCLNSSTPEESVPVFVKPKTKTARSSKSSAFLYRRKLEYPGNPYKNSTYDITCEDAFSHVKCSNSTYEIIISHVKFIFIYDPDM
jgi:hypothetical protein